MQATRPAVPAARAALSVQAKKGGGGGGKGGGGKGGGGKGGGGGKSALRVILHGCMHICIYVAAESHSQGKSNRLSGSYIEVREEENAH